MDLFWCHHRWTRRDRDHSQIDWILQRPLFLSRLAAFFSAGVFSGAFLVCFWEFWVLAMVLSGCWAKRNASPSRAALVNQRGRSGAQTRRPIQNPPKRQEVPSGHTQIRRSWNANLRTNRPSHLRVQSPSASWRAELRRGRMRPAECDSHRIRTRGTSSLQACRRTAGRAELPSSPCGLRRGENDLARRRPWRTWPPRLAIPPNLKPSPSLRPCALSEPGENIGMDAVPSDGWSQ